MPARQYIGARYVTKVYENSQDPGSAEWESGINYEPLTMVTYNMGSYISKKEVPASVGDPASNTQYWTQTGFYNGQIAYLDNKKLDRYSQGPDDWDTTPTESSTKPVTSGGIHSALYTKANQDDVAYIENGSTSSRNFNVGDFLYHDGHLYRVIASISTGESFTPSNITTSKIGAEVTGKMKKAQAVPLTSSSNFADIETYFQSNTNSMLPYARFVYNNVTIYTGCAAFSSTNRVASFTNTNNYRVSITNSGTTVYSGADEISVSSIYLFI